jgi:hypothetical protein
MYLDIKLIGLICQESLVYATWRMLIFRGCTIRRRSYPLQGGTSRPLTLLGEASVDKDTDEALRLCQRVIQQLHSLLLFAVCMESDRLKNHNFEPFILPTLCLRLLAQRPRHRQCCGRVSLGRVYPGLADGELVGLGQMSCCRKLVPVKQGKHLCGGDIRHPKHEVMLAHECFGFSQNGSRAGHISPDKFQAGERHPIRSKGVDALHLSRQLEALLPASLVRGNRTTKLQGNPISFNEALGALHIIGRSSMLKGFDLKAMVFVPYAGATV